MECASLALPIANLLASPLRSNTQGYPSLHRKDRIDSPNVDARSDTVFLHNMESRSVEYSRTRGFFTSEKVFDTQLANAICRKVWMNGTTGVCKNSITRCL